MGKRPLQTSNAANITSKRCKHQNMAKPPLQTSNAANITSKSCENQNIAALLQYLNLSSSSSIEKRTVTRWVYENDMMVCRSISYVPVLYKIFKRIIFDAADSIQKSPSMDDLNISPSIDVTINQDTVVVYTCGLGVPAGNDREEKVSLATTLTENEFCTEFIIEFAYGHYLTKFEQVFTMERKYDPTFANCQPSDNWTKLTFKPNFKKFKMEHLEDDVVGLMKKLVLDMAEYLGKTVKVELNGRFLRIIDSFEDYNHLCMKSAEMSRPVSAIELALSEENAEYRNTWNHHFKSWEELIVFSKADLERSIPSLVDGLIPDQRKVLFCAFERKLYEEINVDQFIGDVSSLHSACHNCEKSLACTIIEMGQDFVGSNNISLLKPNHQFGTRDLGGKDHARARCIYTELNPLTRCLFHEDGDEILRLNESTELNWYIPIIPLVLVNGSRGIGAGWTYIPSYDPKVIIANVKKFLKGDDLDPMDPFYNRFKGTIEKTANKGEYRVWGCIKRVGNQTYEITELPVGMWTGDYLEFLSTMCVGSPNVKDPLIEDIDFNTEDYANVNIKIKIKSDQIASISNLNKNELYEKFKLISTVSTNNMHLFDADGKIKKFDNPEQILKEFCALLPAYYEKRKEILKSKFTQRIRILESKARFIEMVVQGGISVLLKMMKQPEHELISELTPKGILPEQAQEDANNKEEGTWGGYEYLRSLPSRFFSQEYVDKLVEEKIKISLELAALEKRSLSEMWMLDLIELEEKIVEINRKEEAEEKRKRSSQVVEDMETEIADMGEEMAEYLGPNRTDYKSSESESESESYHDDSS